MNNFQPTAEELLYVKKTIWQNEARNLKYFIEVAERAHNWSQGFKCPGIYHQNDISELRKLFNCQRLGYLIFWKNEEPDHCDESCERIYQQAYLSQLIRLFDNQHFLTITNREVDYCHGNYLYEIANHDSKYSRCWLNTDHKLMDDCLYYRPKKTFGFDRCQRIILDKAHQEPHEIPQGSMNRYVYDCETSDLCTSLLADVLKSRDLINAPIYGGEEKFTHWSNLTKLSLQLFYLLILLGLPDQQDESFAKIFCDKYTNILWWAEWRSRRNPHWINQRNKHIEILRQTFKAIDTTLTPKMIDFDSLDDEICPCSGGNPYWDERYDQFVEERNRYIQIFVKHWDGSFIKDFAQSVVAGEGDTKRLRH